MHELARKVLVNDQDAHDAMLLLDLFNGPINHQFSARRSKKSTAILNQEPSLALSGDESDSQSRDNNGLSALNAFSSMSGPSS
jgi:hypothetical protein